MFQVQVELSNGYLELFDFECERLALSFMRSAQIDGYICKLFNLTEEDIDG